jgi:flagellar basal-body rod protein FlgG
MFDAMQIAATGMHAQQLQVDTIANNLANVATPAYKKARVNFADLVNNSTDARAAGTNVGDAAMLTGSSSATGAGVGVSAVSRMFDVGDMRKTDSALDVAIAGEGFLEVSMPDGSLAYTRGGTLKVNADGQLATQNGMALKPGISIPDNAQALTIAADGRISARLPNHATPVELGQLELVRFAVPGALDVVGDNTYRANAASGEPMASRAGESGTGSLQQGVLEGSNVKVVEEMVNLMVAQRAYEASVKVVQASDEMLGLINNLRK